MRRNISELSKEFGISSRTLRFYEEKNLICSERDEHSNHRVYSDEKVEKLKQILILRKLGFSVSEIKDLYESSVHEDHIKMLNEKVNALDSEIADMITKRRILTQMLHTFDEVKLPKNLENLVEVGALAMD